MLVSPKVNEYLGVIAPEGEKALYMGYANIPMAIGSAYGLFMAGNIYDKMGDKANLAIRYLAENYNITENITRPEAMTKLQEYLNISAVDATNLLWKTYDPFQLWYPFAAIGFASALGIFFYSLRAKKYEAGIFRLKKPRSNNGKSRN